MASKVVTLKTICAELDVQPKRARIKLRRAAKNGKFEHDHRKAWEFTPDQVKQVRTILAKAA